MHSAHLKHLAVAIEEMMVGEVLTKMPFLVGSRAGWQKEESNRGDDRKLYALEQCPRSDPRRSGRGKE